MKWGKFPFTNAIGERSIRFKPEGTEFVISADKFGLRISGESPCFATEEELDGLAKAIAEAFQSASWYRREKIGGNLNAIQKRSTEKVGKLIVGEESSGGRRESEGVGQSLEGQETS